MNRVMSRVFQLLLALGVLLVAALAIAQTFGRPPGSSQADVHNPYSSSYLPLLPNQPIKGLSNSPGVSSGSGVIYTWPYYNSYIYPNGLGYPGLGYPGLNYPGLGYSAYDYPGYGYGSYDSWLYPPYDGPAYGWGPVVVPAETLYGPEAVKRFLGVDQASNAGRAAPSRDDRRPAGRAAERGNVRVRESNEEAKALAGKFIAYGDTHFAKGNYSQAVSRYRTAAQNAPDLPETFLRQGFALTALGNYGAAIKSFRRGLLLDEDWWSSALKLDKLYGGQRELRLQHLEALAEAVEQNPHDANLLTLLGLQLFFDGQQQRALTFFDRSDQLGGNEDGALDRFLIAKRDAAPLQAKRAGAVGPINVAQPDHPAEANDGAPLDDDDAGGPLPANRRIPPPPPRPK
jgi:tetratricopeptide (TPR) repeat protein